MTGCDVAAALEAGQIRPYSEASSSEVTNGVLLRADLHTLFGLNLLGINPNTFEIVLDPSLRDSNFKELQRKEWNLPRNPRSHPSKDALRERWKRFLEES